MVQELTAGCPHRMRDLVRLTGFSAPTIHFYAQQGLLPPAQKTAGNQARYPDATVTRLHWIRAVQDELRLPLRSIRFVLERWGELPVHEIVAAQTLGRLMDEPDPAAEAADLHAVTDRLDPGDLEELRRSGLVGTGTATASDLRLLELVAAIRAAGFTTEAGFTAGGIAVYAEAVEQLVEDELRRIVEPLLDRHDPDTLRDLVRRGLPLTNRLLGLLHERAVHVELRRWLQLPDDAGEAAAG